MPSRFIGAIRPAFVTVKMARYQRAFSHHPPETHPSRKIGRQHRNIVAPHIAIRARTEIESVAIWEYGGLVLFSLSLALKQAADRISQQGLIPSIPTPPPGKSKIRAGIPQATNLILIALKETAKHWLCVNRSIPYPTVLWASSYAPDDIFHPNGEPHRLRPTLGDRGRSYASASFATFTFLRLASGALE